MDKSELFTMLKQLGSDNDSDAVMALRGVQALFEEAGTSLANAVTYAADHLDEIAKTGAAEAGAAPGGETEERMPVSVSGMPQCISPGPGNVELIAPGETKGNIVALPGAAADDADSIATGLKDALVAAAINKSRLKLKLMDVKNNRGEIVETILQAEYDRDDMAAVRVWANIKGEAASLATVLRKAVAANFPDLVA